MKTQNKKTVSSKKDPLSEKKKQIADKRKRGGDRRKRENKKLVAYQPDFKAIPSSNVVSTIEIVETMCPYARATWSLALISRLAVLDTKNLDTIYYVYQAMDADFVNAVKNTTPILTSRPAFVNSLLELVRAKTTNTPRLKISYSFNGATFSGAPSPVVDVDGYKYYMLNSGLDGGANLPVMVTPLAVPLEQAIAIYNSALSALVGNTPKKMLQQQSIDERSRVFENDASAYASRSVYTGTSGSCPSGGYASAELEVYAKALSTLSVFVELPATPTRVAHELAFASGDTTTAFGMPYLEQFTMLDYSTRLPPIIKYIDFSECWQLYSQWFAECIRKGWDVEAMKPTIEAYLANPVPLQYAIIALRQTLMKYFHVPQSCTQFQSYTYANTKTFHALRLGTNTVSRLAYPLNLPTLFVENMRALGPRRYCKPGFKAERHCRWYLPCFGLFPDSEFLNPSVVIEGAAVDVFGANAVPPGEATVNYIDGSTVSNVYNFGAACIDSAITKLNEIVVKDSQVCGTTGNLEGTNDFNLLAFTRFDEVSQASLDDAVFENVPKWAHTDTFRDLKSQYETKKKQYEATRTKSSPKFKFVLGAEITNKIPRAFTSSVVITKELQSVLENLIVPSVVSIDPAVTIQVATSGFQVAFSETQSYEVNKPTGSTPMVNSSVAAMLANLGKSLCPGTAAQPSQEVARLLKILQESGKGGFLDAALSGIMTFCEKL